MGSLFNSKPGFHANFIVSASIKSPKEYRVFVIPVQLAERRLATAYKKWHKVPNKLNAQRKPVPMMYLLIRPKAEWTKLRTTAKYSFMPAWDTVLAHESAYRLLLDSSGKPEDISSQLRMELPAESEIIPAELGE
jgi:hypothetical protein